MKAKELSTYENAAVTRAKEDCVDSFLQAVLDIMWDAGIQNLSELDADTYTKIESVARMDRRVQATFEKFMTAYSNYLDKVMSGELPPF